MLDPKRVNEPILAYRMRETNNYMSVSNLLTNKHCFFCGASFANSPIETCVNSPNFLTNGGFYFIFFWKIAD